MTGRAASRVRPSEARLAKVGSCLARRGVARFGRATADLSTEGPRAFPAGFVESRRGGPRRGGAGQGQIGQDRAGLGLAGHQLRQQHGGLRLSLLLSMRADGVRHGRFRSGLPRCGMPRSGAATADLSAEPFGALRWVLRDPDLARQGWHRLGEAGPGSVRHFADGPGAAWTADGSTELPRRLPAALFEEQTWPGVARFGTVGIGGASNAAARFTAWRKEYSLRQALHRLVRLWLTSDLDSKKPSLTCALRIQVAFVRQFLLRRRVLERRMSRRKLSAKL